VWEKHLSGSVVVDDLGVEGVLKGMKWNEAEVGRLLANKSADWEGPLLYKQPKSSSSFPLSSAGHHSAGKERYFKVVGNLLFCLRQSHEKEPLSLLVLEGCSVKRDQQNTFTLSFKTEPENTEKVHTFIAENPRSATQWIEALQMASYERKREALILLQIKLRNKTGVDPLRGTALEHNPVYCGPKDCPNFLPSPPVRKNRGKGKNSGSIPVTSFTSHLGVENWEEEPGDIGEHNGNYETVCSHKPSFRSHVKEGASEGHSNGGEDGIGKRLRKPSFRSHVPVDTLIEF